MMNADQLETIIQVSILKVRRLRNSTSPPQTMNGQSNGLTTDQSVHQSGSRTNKKKTKSPLCDDHVVMRNNQTFHRITSLTSTVDDESSSLDYNQSQTTSTANRVAMRNNVSLLRHLLITRIARKAKDYLTSKNFMPLEPSGIPNPMIFFGGANTTPTHQPWLSSVSLQSPSMYYFTNRSFKRTINDSEEANDLQCMPALGKIPRFCEESEREEAPFEDQELDGDKSPDYQTYLRGSSRLRMMQQNQSTDEIINSTQARLIETCSSTSLCLIKGVS